jgi:hypothetical protein
MDSRNPVRRICEAVRDRISRSISQRHSRLRCHDIVILSQLNRRKEAFFQIMRPYLRSIRITGMHPENLKTAKVYPRFSPPVIRHPASKISLLPIPSSAIIKRVQTIFQIRRCAIHSIAVEICRKIRRLMPRKAKGRFLARGTALSIRFFEALVRLPNYSIVILKSPESREHNPRFPHSSAITRAVRVLYRPSVSIRLPG